MFSVIFKDTFVDLDSRIYDAAWTTISSLPKNLQPWKKKGLLQGWKKEFTIFYRAEENNEAVLDMT